MRIESCRWKAAVVVLGAALSGSFGGLMAQGIPTSPAAGAAVRDASMDDYRAHLEGLETLTAACAKARNAAACDPALVGADERVPWGVHGERQLVGYGWLRVLFERAQRADEAVKAAGPARKADEEENPFDPLSGTADKPDVRTTGQLLEDAQTRLAADLKQADGEPVRGGSHAAERAALKQVLEGREFRRLKQADQGPTALEKFNNWVNSLFEWLGRQQVHAAWIGRTLIWGFLLVVAVGLAWMLLQMERRWRVKLVPENDRPAPTAASARDWQLWLKDAREAAARGEWREAIHFMYWAAISRLESKKMWPADRARTPREYLALVAGDDPRKPGLGALTREFEWTWYGGRAAEESHYRQAEELATALFEGGSATHSGGPGR